MRHRLWIWLLCALAAAPGASAQGPGGTSIESFVGQPIASVRVMSQGSEVRDPQAAGLLEVTPGEPLTMADVRATIVHLMNLGTYLDVRVTGQPAPGGVALDVELVALRELARIVFRGETKLPERVLRDAVTARFGTVLPIGRSTDMAVTLEETYRDYGYLRASVVPRPLDDPSAGPGALAFDVAPGARAAIRSVAYRGSPPDSVAEVRAALGIGDGSAYEPIVLRQRVDRVVASFRADGFLEARVDSDARIDAGGEVVDLTITVTRGSRVRVVFAGDPIDADDQAALVPIAREGSADEDLLEDSQRRIEDHLRAQGFRDARASYTRSEANGVLTIVFTVSRGPLFRLAAIGFAGIAPQAADRLRAFIRSRTGEPFVSARLAVDLAAMVDDYRRRGFASATVLPTIARNVPSGPESVVLVSVTLTVSEGVRTTISRVSYDGTRALAREEVDALVRTRAGDAFYAPTLNQDAERVVTEYRNRGYRLVNVEPITSVSETGAEAAVRFVVREGPQILVEHILVVGNTRTSEATIRRELALRSGDALGDAAVAESQSRLAALGLFRRVTISEIPHEATNFSDVLVTVEEAPATSLGYGGGVEFQKVETSEFAPRGFIELGRRNLWGKNRSVNLFARVSLRRRTDSDGQGLTPGADDQTDLEYRVIGSYREPKFLATRGDLQVAAVFEQGSRTAFSFRHRSARLDFAERVGTAWSYIGQFAISRNEVIDARINPIDRPLIDRLFPQVRLSSVAVTAARDTRDDPFAPSRGSLVSLNGELALRVIGSEIGYAKTFLQGFAYRRLPAAPRVVLAGGVRLGLGTGFPRPVTVTDSNGDPVIGPDGNTLVVEVRDVPISERFFAGGDTTVRGFQLDRLGDAATFDRDGTPIGGHAELILNQEARIGVWRDLGVVGFLDVGNVFALVNDFAFSKLRGGIGFGIRYKSPVGPIRVDCGFKLGALQTYGPTREGRFALHISIGQAF